MIATLAAALEDRGYHELTGVQQAVTAPELSGADLLVSAQTGSGKTVGFGLAIAPTILGEAETLGPAAAPLALVVAPTRELAVQVQRELSWLYAKAGARVASCIGGMDPREERRALDRGAHIVVGTPGRLRDHITRGAFDLADLRAVVLDEADEMLDLGFREDLEFMLAAAPAGRRTLMFSATVSPAIAELAKAYQRDAVRVTTLTQGSQHADIAYQAVQVASGEAENAIINLLRFHDAPAAIVFANTRAAVGRLAARFGNRGLSVVSLSGELSQDERSHALQALRDGRARVCVATDVAARGLDLPNLDLVIHAELPLNAEALLHRSGRTGRAGRKGISALIVPERAASRTARLLKTARIEAQWVAPPTRDEILALDESRLMADPVWQADPTEAEAAFADRLLAGRSPAEVAVACLRLYRAGLSAPEEVSAPGSAAPRADRPAFGPAVRFELSVGHDRRAEARWILPLLCRAGNLDKAQIGRIRVLSDTTEVEIAAAAAAGFQARLGPGGVLEDGIRARRMDAAGETPAAPQHAPQTTPARRPGKPDGTRRPVPAADGRRPAAEDGGQRRRTGDDARPAVPSRSPRPTAGPGPGAAADDRPQSAPKPAPQSAPQPAPQSARQSARQSWAPDMTGAEEPARKPRHKASGKGKAGGTPAGKPAGRPFGQKPGTPAGKPGGKPAGKSGGRAGGGADRARAADPGATRKPGPKPHRKGGKPPSRPKG